MRTTLVFAAGSAANLNSNQLPPHDLVIAADGGFEHAIRIGVTPDVVIGDLDSIDSGWLATVPRLKIDTHPTAKDATDLELALGYAEREGSDRVLLIGGGAGRLDHFLANALLVTSFPQLRLEWWVGDAAINPVHDHIELSGEVGDLLSLLAIQTSHGVTSRGLRYPLAHQTLVAGSTRGVSNQLVEERATVSLESGVLLAIRPHRR